MAVGWMKVMRNFITLTVLCGEIFPLFKALKELPFLKMKKGAFFDGIALSD
jgi:hypothetical protein